MIFFFFFNDTATTEIYTLSLHDALPIYIRVRSIPCARFLPLLLGWSAGHAAISAPFRAPRGIAADGNGNFQLGVQSAEDRKSTRLNSSHGYISYAVFCLKKKKVAIDMNN